MVSFKSTVAAVLLALGVLGAGCGSGGGEMQILDVQPRKGSASGGQRIAILGKNFRTDIGYTVYFGAKKSPAVTIVDPKTLVVETPLMDNAGPVEITLRADNGDAFKIASAFAFEDGASAGAPKGNLKF